MAATTQMDGMVGMDTDPAMQKRMHSLHLAQADDSETMKGKFISLAEAFP